tara:strand:+ start:1901 stop:2569 length:669 start_codon:yes stop_codon:yes gene_type:complete
MKKKLIIVGTGRFPEAARCYFDELSDYEVKAFSCHQKYKNSDSIYGLPLVSIENLSETFSKNDYEIFVAVGYHKMNRTREAIYKEIKSLGYKLASFCHPDVHIWDNIKIGENTFIFEDNTIQPFVEIDDNTILWSGNHIGHHSKIGKNCFISSHVVISGSCRIGNNVFMGVNSTLHDSIEVGKYVLIGAGAIVSKNIDDKVVLSPKRTEVFHKDSDEIGFNW